MAFGAYAPLPLRLGGSPEDGWSAAQHARVCADTVAFTRTAPFAVCRISYLGGLNALLSNYYGQTGVGTGYGPSLVVYDSAGEKSIEMTFPSMAPEDPYGVAAPLTIRAVAATGKGVNTVSAVVSSVKKVTVYLPEAVADDVTVVVW